MAANITKHQEEMMAQIKAVLNKMSIRYKEEADLVDFGVKIDCKLSHCNVRIIAHTDMIKTYAYCPIKARKEDYANVVEFITRANWRLRIDSFAFDYRDGEILCHAVMLCEEGIPSASDVETTIVSPILSLERYGDGLVKNLMGFGDPEKDIAEIANK